MNKRVLYPYIITVLLFVTVYVLTLLIPNRVLYLGLADNWLEVKLNNKIPLQTEIFSFGLIFFLACVNLFQIFTQVNDVTTARFCYSLLSIVVIYLINWGLYTVIDNKVWNLYYYFRGAPASLFGIMTFVLMNPVLLGIDLMVFILFKFISREKLTRHLPNWIVEKR